MSPSLKSAAVLLLLGAGCVADRETADDVRSATAHNDQPSESEAERSGEREPAKADESRPKEDWPDELVKLVERLRNENAEPEYVDVVYADPNTNSPYSDGGFYWRMAADQAAVDAHVEVFGLEKTSAGGLTDKFYDRYPKSWPKRDKKNVTWYAWPYNRDDEPIKAHFWQIMVHDEREKQLYFYYWIWDVGI